MSTLIWGTTTQAITHSRRIARAPLTWDPVSHVLSRFSFGPTPADRAYIARYTIGGWLKNQIALGATYRGYSGHAGVAKQGPLLAMNPYDVRQYLIAEGNEYGWDAMDQLCNVTIGLQGWSRAQLYETLVDFFANHLNVPNHNGDVWNTRHVFDRDVVRRFAMGKFSDMLVASAKSPAMLTYLSLADSTKAHVNENYGRELLELHTVGLRYSESDVKNAAALLTGRTLDDNQHYLFDDYIHPLGKIKVLGFTHPNSSPTGGEAAGDALLKYLAHHPYTATNLARKICLRYVSDKPSADLVWAVAKAYLANDTAIMPMITTILRSTEFWESRGQKVRRPAENILATARTLAMTPTNWDDALGSLHWMMNSMGHVPLEWPAPNGYPDIATAWRSAGALLDQWNLHLGFAGNWWKELGGKDVDTLYGTAKPRTSGEAITMLTKRLTGAPFSAAHRAVLQTFLKEGADTPMSQSVLQWWTEALVALILDAPHHALR